VLLTILITIHLFPHLNKLQVSESLDDAKGSEELFTHQFSRRWECRILCMLINEAHHGRALTETALQATLRASGQQKELNRAQLQRLLDGLCDFFLKLPQQPIRFVTAPRQYTVGPWRLAYTSSVSFTNCETDSSELNETKDSGKHPLLLTPRKRWNAEQSSSDLKIMHEVLTALLTADAFAINGEYADAIHAQQTLEQSRLSDALDNVLKLREAVWQKRLGHYGVAKQLANEVAQNPTSVDAGLVVNANFLLNRISYDESPAKSHNDLWNSMAAPQPVMHADLRVLPEWHNLKALLARRRLIEIGLTTDVQSIHLHFEAIDHLQSSFYWALQFRDWDRLQAYVANLSFHLQCVLPLGLVNVNEVFMWHRLCLTYSDKLSLAQDSGWEYIFLGEFWLDNHAEITHESAADPLAHTVEDTHPSQQSFYVNAISKLTTCADARQIGIMWVLYSRFVMDHLAQTLSSIDDVLVTIHTALRTLMTKNPQLLQTLHAEGYGSHLPNF
jgi:hypothetical protein